MVFPLEWRHDGRDGVLNHKSPDLRLFTQPFIQEQIQENVTGLCARNSPVIPAQMASNAENVSIWWHHHV